MQVLPLTVVTPTERIVNPVVPVLDVFLFPVPDAFFPVPVVMFPSVDQSNEKEPTPLPLASEHE